MGEAEPWRSDEEGSGWDVTPWYMKGGGGMDRSDGVGQARTVTGRGDEALGRWGMITPVATTGLWKAPSSPLG